MADDIEQLLTNFRVRPERNRTSYSDNAGQIASYDKARAALRAVVFDGQIARLESNELREVVSGQARKIAELEAELTRDHRRKEIMAENAAMRDASHYPKDGK